MLQCVLRHITMTRNPYPEASDYLDSARKSLGDIILPHDRGFAVPLNQRPWAWSDAKDVQHFLNDFRRVLTTFFDPNSSPKWQTRSSVRHPPHFFGTFVFYKRGDGERLEIFDGQQRITTVTMLCSILRELAIEQQNAAGSSRRRATQLYGAFDGWLHISPTSPSPKLQPNDLFAGLFDALMLQGHNETERQIAIRALPDPEREHAISKRLIRSHNFLRNGLLNLLESHTAEDTINFLSASYDTLRHLFCCVETLIYDEHYSYDVFESLNARGVPLTHADNIKNELFKIATPDQRRAISASWNRIGGNVPEQQIGEFLRRRFIALHGPCKKQEVYPEVKRTEINQISPGGAVALISSWEQDSLVVHRILQRQAAFSIARYLATTGAHF